VEMANATAVDHQPESQDVWTDNPLFAEGAARTVGAVQIAAAHGQAALQKKRVASRHQLIQTVVVLVLLAATGILAVLSVSLCSYWGSFFTIRQAQHWGWIVLAAVLFDATVLTALKFRLMAVGLSGRVTQRIQSAQRTDSPAVRSAFARKPQENELALDEQSKAKHDCFAVVNLKEISIHVVSAEHSAQAIQGSGLGHR